MTTAAAKPPPPLHPAAGESFSEPAEYAPRPISVEAGDFYFNEAGVGDPYAAGIPYPIFVALLRQYPQELGGSWRGFNTRFGTIPNRASPDDPWALPVGFHLTRDPNTQVEFMMMSCAICHAGRVRTSQGTTVVKGLGNKRLRLHAYDGALMRLAQRSDLTPERLLPIASKAARKLDLTWPVETAAPLVSETLAALKRRARARGEHVARIGDGLPGRIATIEGFIMGLNHARGGVELGLPPVTGWTKIPDVAPWRHRETNSFDGAALGSPVALVAEADFTFGVRPQWYERHRHIPTSIYLYLRAFERRFPFPGKVDVDLARRGHEAFEANCSHCHGHYAPPDAPERWVAYRETTVPLQAIGTDPARANAVTDELIDAANTHAPTRGLARTRRSAGYVPRPLNGVWLRGLYGHNGQWPDLQVLATAPEERPRRFLVDPAAPLDLQRVGTRWRTADRTPKAGEYLYDGATAGFDVGGHEYLSRLGADDRRAIVEYLKTL